MGETRIDGRLEEVKNRLKLIQGDHWRGLGIEWLRATATRALDEILALEVGLAVCVDGGTADTLRGALADIAFSEDMTLEVARAKAKRIYELTSSRA